MTDRIEPFSIYQDSPIFKQPRLIQLPDRASGIYYNSTGSEVALADFLYLINSAN